MKQSINRIKYLIIQSYKADKLMFVGIFILNIICGLNVTLIAYFSKDLFDYILDIKDNNILIVKTCLFTLSIILNFICNSVFNKSIDIFADKTSNYLSLEYVKHLKNIYAINYENYEFLQTKDLILDSLSISGYLSIIIISTIFCSIPSILLNSYIYFTYHFILVIIPIILFVGNLLIAKNKFDTVNNLEEELKSSIKQRNLSKKMLLDKHFIAEVRHYKSFEFLKTKYKNSYFNYVKVKLDISNNKFKNEIINSSINYFVFISIVAILVFLFKNNMITLGSLGSVFITYNMLSSNIEELFFNQIQTCLDMYPSINAYFDFIDSNNYLDNRKTIEIESIESIEFKNVYFKYGDDYVLNDISFKLNKDEILAIVGVNGSGKTTISKLISSLYVPNKGDVYINGYNTKKYKFIKYVSIMNQELIMYPFSVKENITFDTSKQIDIKLDNIDLNDVLTKDFGNRNISKGQLQKLSLEKAKFKNHKMLIVDEPTSALDPQSELHAVNEIFETSKGKISIIITHRLNMCNKCYKIMVLEKGKIKEFDTFVNLMKHKNDFYKMYNSQSCYYN